MKTNHLYILPLVILLFVAGNQLFAQKNEISKGYYITTKFDTVQADIEIEKNLSSDIKILNLQKRLVVLNIEGKKVKLYPKDIIEFSFSFRDEKFIFRKCYHLTDDNRVILDFLHLIQDGCIATYEIYYEQPMGPYVYIIEHTDVYCKNKGEIIYAPGKSDFAEKMSKWLSDCPELLQKIKNNEYTHKDFEQLINDYNNTYCKTK